MQRDAAVAHQHYRQDTRCGFCPPIVKALSPAWLRVTLGMGVAAVTSRINVKSGRGKTGLHWQPDWPPDSVSWGRLFAGLRLGCAGHAVCAPVQRYLQQ